MQAFTKVGLDALLTPENCVLILIRVASLLKHTIWQFAASWLRGSNPLLGLRWRANSSAIGLAQNTWETSLSSLSTMPALLDLHSCGRRSC